ncbi:MAG: hypothetical protein AAGU27_01285 [Dehalobacterium sp.]
MKKLIAGIFIVQIIVLVALGIPAGGAANAIWKDEVSGVVVRQDNPVNTIDSYYRLLDNESYDAAVLLLEKDVQENVNGDILKASLESIGWQETNLVKLIPSSVVGNYAVVASVRTVNSNPDEPALSIATLRQVEGKWEIIQQMNNSDLEEVKQVLERAVEVCDLIVKDPFPGLSDTQRTNIKTQAELGGQYIAANLEQLNQMIEDIK